VVAGAIVRAGARPWVVIGAAVIVQVGAVVAMWDGADPDAGAFAFIGAAVVALIFTGWLVHRVPDNRVSWVLLWAVVFFTTGQLFLEYTEVAVAHGLPFPRLAGLVSQLGWWPPIVLVMVLLPLLFPTGTLLSKRWRVVAVAALAGMIGALVAQSYLILTVPLPDLATITSDSWPEAPPVLAGVELTGQLVVLAAALVALASAILRYRRAGTVERLQMKWVLLSIAAVVVGLFGTMIGQGRVFENPMLALAVLGLVSFPIAVSMAILRYRLFEVDRLLNRAVVYVIVVGLLGLLFVAGAIWLPSLLRFESSVAVAASTLTVAALFNPLRRRVQRLVDRRFYRSRYDAQEVVDEFSARLRDQVDPDVVAEEWADVVQRTLQPASVAVWVRENEE
jgi:hypothetical protein